MATLNSVYESTNIQPKKPFTEEHLKNVVSQYNHQYGDNVEIRSIVNTTAELSTPKDEFSFINMVESTLQKNKCYKLIDGKFIISF